MQQEKHLDTQLKRLEKRYSELNPNEQGHKFYKLADILNEDPTFDISGTKYKIARAEKAHQELKDYFAKNGGSAESDSTAEETSKGQLSHPSTAQNN